MCVCSLYGKYQGDGIHIPFSIQEESKKNSQCKIHNVKKNSQGNTQ